MLLMETPSKLMTIAQLADIAGQSTRTIHRRIAAGALAVVYPGGSHTPRIHPDEAARYLAVEQPDGSGIVDGNVHPIREERP